MSLTGFRVPIELRNARRWLASIFLLALAGGAALTAAQAARRTDTAFARALAEGHASDAVVNADTFQRVNSVHHGDAAVGAVRVGETKLIDNIIF